MALARLEPVIRKGPMAYLPTMLLQTGLGESARQGTHP